MSAAEPQQSACQAEQWLRPVADRFNSSRSSTLSYSGISLQDHLDLDRKALATPPPSATIKSLIDEPLFSGYQSEEEEASSPDTDEMSLLSSLGSFDDDEGDDFDANFPEMLAESCTFVGQHAQAVRIRSPGRPKVIELAKPDSPRSSTASSRPSLTASVRTPAPKSRHRSIADFSWASISDRSSSYTSDTLSSTSMLSSTASTPKSAHSPATPQYSLDNVSPSLAPGSDAAKSRLRNPYRLRLFPKRMTSLSEFRNSISQQPVHAPAVLVQQPQSAPPAESPVYNRHSQLLQQPSRLVARGPTEREPLVQLPPFPSEYKQPTVVVKERVVYSVLKGAPTAVPVRKPVGGRERMRRMTSGFGLNER